MRNRERERETKAKSRLVGFSDTRVKRLVRQGVGTPPEGIWCKGFLILERGAVSSSVTRFPVDRLKVRILEMGLVVGRARTSQSSINTKAKDSQEKSLLFERGGGRKRMAEIRLHHQGVQPDLGAIR